MRLAIVGTGLIGASVGLAARAAGIEQVSGWDVDVDALAVAGESASVFVVQSSRANTNAAKSTSRVSSRSLSSVVIPGLNDVVHG